MAVISWLLIFCMRVCMKQNVMSEALTAKAIEDVGLLDVVIVMCNCSLVDVLVDL